MGYINSPSERQERQRALQLDSPEYHTLPPTAAPTAPTAPVPHPVPHPAPAAVAPAAHSSTAPGVPLRLGNLTYTIKHNKTHSNTFKHFELKKNCSSLWYILSVSTFIHSVKIRRANEFFAGVVNPEQAGRQDPKRKRGLRHNGVFKAPDMRDRVYNKKLWR